MIIQIKTYNRITDPVWINPDVSSRGKLVISSGDYLRTSGGGKGKGKSSRRRVDAIRGRSLRHTYIYIYMYISSFLPEKEPITLGGRSESKSRREQTERWWLRYPWSGTAMQLSRLPLSRPPLASFRSCPPVRTTLPLPL